MRRRRRRRAKKNAPGQLSQGGALLGGAGRTEGRPEINRPPVTELTPEVHPETFLRRRLPVQTRDGEFLYWASDEHARDLLREQKVELLWGGKRVRALRVIDEQAMTEHFGRSDWSGHTSSRHYSHDHETPTNPRGVWTLTHLGKAA